MCVPSNALVLTVVALVIFARAEAGQSPAQPSRTPPPRLLAAVGQQPPLSPAVIARDPDGRVTVRAIRILDPLVIDGRPDERPYRDTLPIDGFVQQEPNEGAPATEKTEVWLFFDNDNVYISARCWDSQPHRMVADELRRDSSNQINNEYFLVALDTFHDRRNGFAFVTTPLGAATDLTFVDERSPNRDWNTVWRVETGRFEGGWTLEMAIPFKSLRYGPGTEQVWGIQIARFVRWKNERSYLAPLPAAWGSIGVYRVSAAATAVGIEAPPLGKNLEVKPYAIAGLTTDRTARPGISNDPRGDVGVDVNYGLTPSLTANVTYNTDFAQVEEDEQQVNLTRFNLFFPEKREFFLEGQGIFAFGGTSSPETPLIFFSRQIGLSAGRPVPILAGGRLTGKAGPYSLGIVNVQTEEQGPAEATNFAVVRIRREILRNSTIGALFTNRSESVRTLGSNQAYGVDAVLSLFQNVRINAYLAGTRTQGLSRHATSYRAEIDYAPDRYGLRLERLSVGQNFNPEIGFLRRSNFTKSTAFVRFSPRPRSMPRVRKLFWEGTYNYFTTGNGGLESRDASAAFRAEFENSDRFNLEYSRSYDLLSTPFAIAPNVTVPIGGYGFHELQVSYQLGQQRKLSGTISATRGTFYGGHQTAAAYRGRLAFGAHLSLDPSISINWIDMPQGAFTTKLAGSRVTVPVTPRMFVSALIQYNSTANTFSSNMRLRWEYQPGSELFVVFTEGRNTRFRGFPDLETRGLVVKINRLFRM